VRVGELDAPDTARRKGEGSRKGESSILLQEKHGTHFHAFLPPELAAAAILTLQSKAIWLDIIQYLGFLSQNTVL